MMRVLWAPITRRKLWWLKSAPAASKLRVNHQRFLSYGDDQQWRNAKSSVRHRRTPTSTPWLWSPGETRERASNNLNSSVDAATSHESLTNRRLISKLDEKLNVSTHGVGLRLRAYERALFGDDNVVEERDSGPSRILYEADLLRSRCLSHLHALSVQRIQDSERQFSDLCGMIQHSIFLAIKEPSANAVATENLMKALYILVNGRQKLLLHVQNNETGILTNVIGWVTNLFSTSSDDKKTESSGVYNATSMSVPDLYAQFAIIRKEVLAATFFEVSKDVTNATLLSNRAARLLSLMEIGIDDVPITLDETGLIVQACAPIGTMFWAQKAEHLWRVYNETPWSLNCVLQAYLSVACNPEIENIERYKAAEIAEKLVLEAPSSYWPDYASKCTAFSVALHAMSVADWQLVPNRCARAEKLVTECIGQRAFKSLLKKRATDSISLITSHDLPLLHFLVVIYSTQKDAERLKQAKVLLQHMQHFHQFQLSVTEKSSSAVISLPSIDTYRSILRGIARFANPGTDRIMLLEMANYATGLLDTIEKMSLSPDVSIFNQLLRIWGGVKSIDSGERAEALLNRMLLKELCTPDFFVSAVSYRLVIQSWQQSSQIGHSRAAERANLLLRFMEAQSGVLCRLTPLEKGFLGTYRRNKNDVYNDKLTPDIRDYNMVLEACITATDGVAIATEVHSRLCQTPIQPTASTYHALFQCLSEQLETDSPQRQALAVEIREVAKASGKLDEDTLAMVKALEEDLCQGLEKFISKDVES